MYFIKKAILSFMMNRQKERFPFNIEHSDRYVLPKDARGDYNNSQYFYAHSPETQECFFIRWATRGGAMPNELWFSYRNAAGEVFVADSDHLPKEIPPAVSINVLRAGQKISFTFRGKVKRVQANSEGEIELYTKSSESFGAEFSAEFISHLSPFEFSRHIPTENIASAFSREEWSLAFLKSLKDNHQVHYEQGGHVNGKLTIGSDSYVFERFPAFRDHSYGKREWNYFDRYVWIFGLLENGDVLQCNWVRYPVVRELQTGFYSTADNVCVSLKRATPLNELPLNDNKCPKSIKAELEFEDGRKLILKTQLELSFPYQFGDFRVNEGMSSFDLGGLKGRGITEFSFNGDRGRWTR